MIVQNYKLEDHLDHISENTNNNDSDKLQEITQLANNSKSNLATLNQSRIFKVCVNLLMT
jgi:hypothetical protein